MDSVEPAGFGTEVPKQRGLFWPLALFLCFAAVLTIAAAFGGEPLRIEVTGGAIRVRDVVELGRGFGTKVPKQQEVPSDKLDAVFADGLRPGEERAFSAADLAARLVELGLSSELAPDKTIVVRRRSRVIAADELVAAGEKAIREQIGVTADDEVTLTPVMLPHSLLAPIGQVRLDTAMRRPTLAGGLWVADVTARADDWSAKTTIRYRLRVATNVLVTRRAVKRNQTLTESDVSLEKRDLAGLRGEPMRDVAELLDRRAARPVPPGTVVTGDWLETAPVVRRSEVVTAMARVGGVTASTRVVALRDGGVGEVIPVRPQGQTSGQTHALEFAARVVAPGRVEVTSP